MKNLLTQITQGGLEHDPYADLRGNGVGPQISFDVSCRDPETPWIGYVENLQSVRIFTDGAGEGFTFRARDNKPGSSPTSFCAATGLREEWPRFLQL